jgi:hypothetical protein
MNHVTLTRTAKGIAFEARQRIHVRFRPIANTFPPELASILVAMMHKASMPCSAFVALPALVLLGYGMPTPRVSHESHWCE